MIMGALVAMVSVIGSWSRAYEVACQGLGCVPQGQSRWGALMVVSGVVAIACLGAAVRTALTSHTHAFVRSYTVSIIGMAVVALTALAGVALAWSSTLAVSCDKECSQVDRPWSWVAMVICALIAIVSIGGLALVRRRGQRIA